MPKGPWPIYRFGWRKLIRTIDDKRGTIIITSLNGWRFPYFK
jgi:hypothetical protein